MKKKNRINLKISDYIFIICLIFLFGVSVLVIVNKENLPPFIPLFYGRPQGEMQIAPSIFLLIPNFLAILFIAIYLFIYKTVKEDFLKNFSILLTILTTSLALITTLKIFFLVANL